MNRLPCRVGRHAHRAARSIGPIGIPNGDTMNTTEKKRGGWSWWYLLFVIQFAVALWPPFYNKAEPYLFGIPFFYWFQLLWVIVSAVFTAIVYFAVEE